MRKKRKELWESAYLNDATYQHYYNRLTELAVSMFEWKNLPDTIDPRFLELTLFGNGVAVFFQDDVIGYLALQTMLGGKLDVYRIPNDRTAYAVNGYNRKLDSSNSVLIFNNMLHTNTVSGIEYYARLLYELDRTMYVNIKAQKTPIMILCDESQRLVMKNLYQQYDGNEPFIFGSKNLDMKSIQALSTNAPFLADRIIQIKSQIWNEALTYLGISNSNCVKKERLISDEVTRNMGATVSSRYTRLDMRKQACKQINEMFGLDIDVEYREDYQVLVNEGDDMVQVEEGDADE